MISRDSVVFIWRAHRILILQKSVCIIFYRSINVEALLHGLEAHENYRDFRSIGVAYIVMRDQMSYMPWRGLGTPKVFLGIFGGKCANLLPTLHNALT